MIVAWVVSPIHAGRCHPDGSTEDPEQAGKHGGTETTKTVTEEEGDGRACH